MAPFRLSKGISSKARAPFEQLVLADAGEIEDRFSFRRGLYGNEKPRRNFFLRGITRHSNVENHV